MSRTPRTDFVMFVETYFPEAVAGLPFVAAHQAILERLAKRLSLPAPIVLQMGPARYQGPAEPR